MSVDIGADPEFFLIQTSGEERDMGNFVPSVGIVPGTKEKPYYLEEGIFCHEDNVCLELGFPPCETAQDFSIMLATAKDLVVEQFLKEEYMLCTVPSVSFTPIELESKQANEFGCDPDFDAYTAGKVRKQPKLPTDFRYHRTAGGHIHIGGNFNCPPFVAALFADLFLGISPIKEGYAKGQTLTTNARSQWYGKAGIFRPKPYGIEYRTPSSWWCGSQRTMQRVGQLAMNLGNYLERTTALSLRAAVGKIPWLDVQEVLNMHHLIPHKEMLARTNNIIHIAREHGVDV